MRRFRTGFGSYLPSLSGELPIAPLRLWYFRAASPGSAGFHSKLSRFRLYCTSNHGLSRQVGGGLCVRFPARVAGHGHRSSQKYQPSNQCGLLQQRSGTRHRPDHAITFSLFLNLRRSPGDRRRLTFEIFRRMRRASPKRRTETPRTTLGSASPPLSCHKARGWYS